MTRTYHGSCHCGDVRFEADLDLSKPTGKCNCSYCSKVRSWGVIVAPDAFRLESSPGKLVEYRFGTMSNGHRFCGRCGIHTFSEGHLDVMGGDFVAVQIATLDDVTPQQLAAIRVVYQDGRANDWRHEPAETRYL